MRTARRSGFTLFQLLIVIALLFLLLGLLLAATGKVRMASKQAMSMNNLKQLGLALHSYHDSFGQFPPGVDAKNFSASAKLLPFIEQDAVYRKIDFKKSVDDKDNAAMRAVRIKTFESPQDPQGPPKAEYGPTNYLYNNLVFYRDSKLKLTDILDGTSNTVMIGETLKGDGKAQAEDVRRQHVLLGKDDLKGLKPDAGVKYFKEDKNIASDRCASWMDGRFLQGTFNGELGPNDSRPDVSCGGEGGVSALRSLEPVVIVALCDGSVRTVKNTISHANWKRAIDPVDNEVLNWE